MNHSNKEAGDGSTGVRVETDTVSVQALVPDVRRASDANTKALGFIAVSVFEQYARRGQLFVATVRDGIRTIYAGHVLFDLRFPRAHVLQIHCAPSLRGRGVASAMLATLTRVVTELGYLSIQARVAEDLRVANRFWEKRSFHIQRTELGKGNPPRKLLVRVHELDSPQLFARSALAANPENPLGLRRPSMGALPLYLIDLNVLFDLAQQRVRHQLAVRLFQGFHSGHCRLAISDEMNRELTRTSNTLQDPMLQLIQTLPVIPLGSGSEATAIVDRVAALVFPDRARGGQLAANDRSDVRHICTAIEHGLQGFITSDNALLLAAPLIEADFGLRVLSPAEFEPSPTEKRVHRAVITRSAQQLTLKPVSMGDAVAIRRLLVNVGVTLDDIAQTWLSPSAGAATPTRFGVWAGGDLIGFMTATSPLPGAANIDTCAAVDESHAEAHSAARFLLRTLITSLSRSGPRELRLVLPSQQTELRDHAHQFGFRPAGAGGVLVKIAVGGIITPENWKDFRESIASATNLRLPTKAPVYASDNQAVEILCPDGERRLVPIDLLESYLSPVLLCLTGRPAVVQPIQKGFADALLGTSRQHPLLPAGTAELHSERHFVCHARALKLLRRGTLMLFYESAKKGGEKAITAVARVTESFLKRRDALDDNELERTVLDSRSLQALGKSPMKTFAAIDNILPLPRPVGYARLRLMGFNTPNHLIAARAITSEQLHKILKEAFDES